MQVRSLQISCRRSSDCPSWVIPLSSSRRAMFWGAYLAPRVAEPPARWDARSHADWLALLPRLQIGPLNERGACPRRMRDVSAADPRRMVWANSKASGRQARSKQTTALGRLHSSGTCVVEPDPTRPTSPKRSYSALWSPARKRSRGQGCQCATSNQASTTADGGRFAVRRRESQRPLPR